MMRPFPQAVFAAALTLASAASADSVNLLVMGEDVELETIKRNNPIVARVREAIATELRLKDIHVYDETAVTMDFYDLDRVRRPDAELISLARSVQIVPIDAVATFEIYADEQPSPYEGITDLRIRISGRVIEIASGGAVGAYEVSLGPGDLPSLPLNCNRACVLEFVGDQAVPIARGVGAALAAQLETAINPEAAPAALPCEGAPVQSYTLTLTGFSPEEQARIERFLGVFKGYVGHQLLETGALSYETCAPFESFEQNLAKMFAQTGADVWLETDGTEISAAKLD